MQVTKVFAERILKVFCSIHQELCNNMNAGQFLFLCDVQLPDWRSMNMVGTVGSSS